MGTSQKFNFGRWLRSWMGLTFLVFLAIAAFFLITEHKAHLFGVLPYALLLISLLLYLFIRRGRGSDNARDGNQPQDRK